MHLRANATRQTARRHDEEQCDVEKGSHLEESNQKPTATAKKGVKRSICLSWLTSFTRFAASAPRCASACSSTSQPRVAILSRHTASVG